MDDAERRKWWSERSTYWTAVSDDSRGTQRHCAPSAQRNAAPIRDVLREVLPPSGLVLEIGSGTGQHAAAFARDFPHHTWLPSDPEPAARGSIEAWRAEAGVPNLRPPLMLDLLAPDWERSVDGPCAGILAANVLHITPWEATLGLLRGASRLLAPEGVLAVYGCFLRDGDPLSDGNAEFDRSLKHRDAAWGLRDTADVAAAARPFGLTLTAVWPMPANNTLVELRPAAGSASA